MRIRTIGVVAVIGAVVLVLAALVPLIWSAQVLGRANAQLAQDAERAALENRIERTLDAYHRESNIGLLTAEDTSDAQRALATSLRALLRRAPAYAHTDRERRTIAEIDRDVEAYVDARARLDASGLPMGRVVDETAVRFDRAKDALREWRQASAAETSAVFARAEDVQRISLAIASAAALILVALAIVATFVIRRIVIAPILDLHRAIAGLREGDNHVRAKERGALELAEVSHALNELIDAVGRQRRGELAFLASVAHDLRNPLSAMKMGVQILGEGEERPTQARTIAMLDRQMDRLAHMIEELFDATRVAAGQIELERGPFDLRETVHHAVQLYELSAPTHEVVAHLPDAPVTIDGDMVRIEQVVNNLVSNAIKYSPGAAHVDIRVSADADCAELSVTDRGIGIPPEEIPDLFMPFRRRAPDVAPGAGLGLSVVRRIVTAHGGRIDVESVVGSGSTFRVRIPLWKRVNAREERAAQTSAPR